MPHPHWAQYGRVHHAQRHRSAQDRAGLGPYDDAFFLDDNDRFLDKDELVQRARAAGRTTHVCGSIKAYRALVFGSAANRGHSHDQRRFNVLVGYPNHAKRSLEGVHAILCATLDNKVDERLLRKLLFDQAAREADIDVEGLTRINLSTEDLEGWLGNFRGINTMRAKVTEAHATIDTGKALRTLGYGEAVLRQALDERAKSIEESLKCHRTILGAREIERDELENEYKGQKREHDGVLQKHREREFDAKGEKESLERRKRAFERDEIHEKLRLAESYEEKASTHRQADVAYQMLKSKSANIDLEIDRRIKDAKRDYDQSVERIEADRERVDKEAANGRVELDQGQADARRELEERLTKESERLSEAESKANSAHATAKIALEALGADPKLVEKRDEARQQKDDTEVERRAAEKTEQRARQERDIGLDALEKLRKKQLDLTQRKKAREDEQSEIAERLQREGTLLEFVREHVENWEGTVAATLNRGTELLYAKDLKPELAERTEESFFGVTIDTSRLDPIDVDRREKERLLCIERELSTLKGDIDAVERELLRATRGQSDLDRAQRDAERSRILLDCRVEGAEQALKQAEAQVDESRQTRRKCFGETFEVARTRLSRARENLEGFRQRSKSERDDLEKLHLEAISEFDRDIDGRRRHCAERKSEAKAQRSANIDRLEGIRRQRGSEAGVSIEDIERRPSRRAGCRRGTRGGAQGHSRCGQMECPDGRIR
ncbi:MAG: ATP-binding protein [Gammaproteobacteria bacterium]